MALRLNNILTLFLFILITNILNISSILSIESCTSLSLPVINDISSVKRTIKIINQLFFITFLNLISFDFTIINFPIKYLNKVDDKVHSCRILFLIFVLAIASPFLILAVYCLYNVYIVFKSCCLIPIYCRVGNIVFQFTLSNAFSKFTFYKGQIFNNLIYFLICTLHDLNCFSYLLVLLVFCTYIRIIVYIIYA